MKLKISVIFAALLLSQPVFSARYAEPPICPSVPAISAIGVDQAVPIGDMWILYKWKNDFGTDRFWSLDVIALGYETMEPTAIIAEVNAKLFNFTLSAGPTKEHKGDTDRWVCAYSSADDINDPAHPKTILAGTVTPPGPLSLNLSQLTKLKNNFRNNKSI